MTDKAQSVLLTGGAGFIGSHLAERLISGGVNVTIVDNINDFYPRALKRENLECIGITGPFRFFSVDILDRAEIERIFDVTRPDTVVHLAAYAGVRPSIENPALYERVNITGTLNLLETCRKFRTPRFVFGSSSSVYGASSQAPFREDHVESRPISPYAATKLSGELLCYTYAHLFGITVNALRFFTVYGPRQRPDLAINKFTALIEAGRPLPFFGDGTAGRDYTYIDDIVDGIIAAMAYEPPLQGGARYEVFNLGNSHPVKLMDLVHELEKATGRPALLDRLPDQPGDVPLTWADISRARKLLGYEPKTMLPEGLRKFVDWYRHRNIAELKRNAAAMRYGT